MRRGGTAGIGLDPSWIAFALLAAGASGCTSGDECTYRDVRVGDRHVGALGLTPDEAVELVGVRTFDAVPDDGYGVDESHRLAISGPFTLSAERGAGRAVERTWQSPFCVADPSIPGLLVPVEARLVSADGQIDVGGPYTVMPVEVDGEVTVAWTWTGDPIGLLGDVPRWMEATAAEQDERVCRDARRPFDVIAIPSRGVDAPVLSFEARHAERGVCHYAAVLAVAQLVPSAEDQQP